MDRHHCLNEDQLIEYLVADDAAEQEFPEWTAHLESCGDCRRRLADSFSLTERAVFADAVAEADAAFDEEVTEMLGKGELPVETPGKGAPDGSQPDTAQPKLATVARHASPRLSPRIAIGGVVAASTLLIGYYFLGGWLGGSSHAPIGLKVVRVDQPMENRPPGTLKHVSPNRVDVLDAKTVEVNLTAHRDGYATLALVWAGGYRVYPRTGQSLVLKAGQQSYSGVLAVTGKSALVYVFSPQSLRVEVQGILKRQADEPEGLATIVADADQFLVKQLTARGFSGFQVARVDITGIDSRSGQRADDDETQQFVHASATCIQDKSRDLRPTDRLGNSKVTRFEVPTI